MSAADRLRMPRRGMCQRTSAGLLGAALASLLEEGTRAADQHAAPANLHPRPPHHPAAATAAIQLFMNGGPSQMDLFDPKTQLDRFDGKPFPGNRETLGNQGTGDIGVVMGSRYRFRRHGESGQWLADVLPCTAQHVDKICFMHSLWTDHPNHDNALYKIHSGRLFMGYPTLPAWIVYGLGSENQNLPAYVVLTDPLGPPKNGDRNWTNGFLPPVFQGTALRSAGAPILNLRPQYDQPDAVTAAARRLQTQLDELHRHERPFQPDLDARIEAWGLAARMQLAATEALDISHETRQTLEMYGIGQEPTDSYGRRCLLARRLIERGVRFVQLFMEEQPWDSHADLAANHAAVCRRTDRPTAALLRDLRERGLLDSTLVIWGGEFGRTPTTQRAGRVYTGRDHNMQGFTSWLAGGGVQGGMRWGETDEFGHRAIENPVSVADFHATLLHLLGLDDRLLSWERAGLEERLTGIEPPRVVHEILRRAGNKPRI